MMNEFLNKDATELISAFVNQTINLKNYYKSLFQYIENQNLIVNAVTSLEKEKVLERISKLENKNPQEFGILYGLPIFIKENIQKIGYSVQCASKILKDYKGQYDSTLVTLLEEADAIIVGTTNMDEFAMGSSNEHSVHGPVKNPHNLSYVSGGSSGGSSVAVTLGFSPISFGSDTGGSVREPASFCGIFGYKPTYGRVSRYGLVAHSSSLDQISPFSRSARDIDLILNIIGKKDFNDATTLNTNYSSVLNKISLKGKKIGVLRHLIEEDIEDNVKKSFIDMENHLKNEGCEMIDIQLTSIDHALSVYYIIASSEASSNLARFDGIRYGQRTQKNCEDLTDLYCKTRSEGFGEQVKLRIMLGTFALSSGYYDAFYGKAMDLRQKMSEELDNIFKNVDFVYLPTTPSSAFPLGNTNQNSVKEYLFDIFTVTANLTGAPAISIPAPVSLNQMPIGLQFMAKKGNDAELVAFAYELEKKKYTQTTKIPSNIFN